MVRQWDGVENKTTVAIYAGGALTALWLSSTLVGAINTIPLVCYPSLIYASYFGDSMLLYQQSPFFHVQKQI